MLWVCLELMNVMLLRLERDNIRGCHNGMHVAVRVCRGSNSQSHVVAYLPKWKLRCALQAHWTVDKTISQVER